MSLITRARSRHAGSLTAALGMLLAMFVLASPSQAAPGDPNAGDEPAVIAAAAPVTPEPVTFPDACTVVVPQTDNVTYFVSYGDQEFDEELSADTYDGSEFFNGDESVRFFAIADEGFELAEGVVTEWDFTAGEECFSEGPTLVTTDASCGAVEFTNVFDRQVEVLYGDPDKNKEDGSFTLDPDESLSIKTTRDLVIYIAFGDDEEAVQVDLVDVPQKCGNGDNDNGGSDHPTVAPAAGLGQ